MIEELLNPWIRDLVPYSSARSEFSGRADILLDANESWEGGNDGVNRYPDPTASALRLAIEREMGLPYGMTAIGNGSDEVIDLLIRMFCAPGRDSIMIERPTYGTYSVFARTSDISVIDVPLTPSLELDTGAMLDAIAVHRPKIVFICSPNNPTGRVYPLEDILRIAKSNEGITVVDEAYADFSPDFRSTVPSIADNPRIVVLRTFSKAYGIAGARLGILVASPDVQRTFMKVKPPYNVSSLAEKAGLEALSDMARVRSRIAETISRREEFSSYLGKLPFVREVLPSEANFVLARVDDASALYDHLISNGIVIRNRSSEPMLAKALRITIGSEEEMDRLKEVFDGWRG